MNMGELIRKHLRSVGATGLCDPIIECGCGTDDLQPCSGSCLECIPAKRQRAKQDGDTYSKGDWIYVPIETKEKA